MSRLVAVLVALLALMGLSTTSALAVPLEPPACDWTDNYETTILALDGSLDAWRVEPVPLYGQVSYDERVARIDPGTPCLFVDETVKHEWLHLQQARLYGGRDGVYARYGSADNAERVADCGAWLLGSRVTPYIDPVWNHGYIGPCTVLDVLEAVWLITRPVTDGRAQSRTSQPSPNASRVAVAAPTSAGMVTPN